MFNFTRFVSVLVWLSSIVAIGFGIQHHLAIYDPFVLVSSIIYVIVIIGLRWAHPNRKLTSLFQLFLIINMFFNGFGTFRYYRTAYFYDDVVHFISPATLLYAGAIWQQIRNKPFWPALVFTLIITIGWEPTEISLDYFFKTQTYGQVGQEWDTLYDILMGLAGIAAASAIYFKGRTNFMRWLRS